MIPIQKFYEKWLRRLSDVVFSFSIYVLLLLNCFAFIISLYCYEFVNIFNYIPVL